MQSYEKGFSWAMSKLRSLDDLRTKLNTFGASGQDEIVVVVRQDADTAFAPEVQRSLSGLLSGAESLRDLGDQVESNFDGVEVTFKRFNEVETSRWKVLHRRASNHPNEVEPSLAPVRFVATRTPPFERIRFQPRPSD